MKHIHLGFDYYGAGNAGDDLMLAGFLHHLSTARRRFRITCCCSHGIASQRLRFPQIEWVTKDDDVRFHLLRNADIWLGLGDTPFQSDSGNWFSEHLEEELTLLNKTGTRAFMLGVGVNNREVAYTTLTRQLVDRMEMIWTRDGGSAAILRQASGRDNIQTGADLAHIWLGSLPPVPENVRPPSSLVCVIHSEKAQQIDICAIAEFLRVAPKPVRWFCQDTRSLGSSEIDVYEAIGASNDGGIELCCPAYSDAEDVQSLWRDFAVPGALCLTSRYHSALVAAWSGMRPLIFARNDKLLWLAEQTGVTVTPTLGDLSVIAECAQKAQVVDLCKLRHFEKQAAVCVDEFLESTSVSSRSIDRTDSPSAEGSRNSSANPLAFLRIKRQLDYSETDRATRLSIILHEQKENASLRQRIDEIEADRSARLSLIHDLQNTVATLRQQNDEIEADRAARLKVIRHEQAENAALRQRIAEIEADRSARLGVIHDLHDEVAKLRQRIDEIEADRAARLELIRNEQAGNAALRQRIEEIQADREERLSVILKLQHDTLALHEHIGRTKADSDAQATCVAKLVEELAESRRLLAKAETGDALKTPAFSWVNKISKAPSGRLIKLCFRLIGHPIPPV
jgi:polysaccharide pyruvyl transferase WcaK-like protein